MHQHICGTSSPLSSSCPFLFLFFLCTQSSAYTFTYMFTTAAWYHWLALYSLFEDWHLLPPTVCKTRTLILLTGDASLCQLGQALSFAYLPKTKFLAFMFYITCSRPPVSEWTQASFCAMIRLADVVRQKENSSPMKLTRLLTTMKEKSASHTKTI